jgi:hypothetical protein
MGNPTTNFGWQMPTATDLVTDLPADFEVFGQAVDTDFVDLLGGTTGQVLSKTSGTDLAFTWIAQDDTNAIQNAIVDAKGDLIAATAADTPARLAVGTDGYILTADSAEATGLKWTAGAAGGSLTLLSTTTLNSGTTSQTISGISSAYEQLLIVAKNVKMASNGASWSARLNSDTGSNYLSGYVGVYWGGASQATTLRTDIFLGSRNSSSASWNKQGYATEQTLSGIPMGKWFTARRRRFHQSHLSRIQISLQVQY